MKQKVLIAFLTSLLLFSCKQENEKVTLTLNEIQFPETNNSSLPYLYTDEKDLLLSFVSENDRLTTHYYSKLAGETWSTPEAITSGSDWFVNWADYPQIAKNGENYIAHILQKSDTTTYAYDVMVTQKQLGGSWSRPFKIHNDTTKTEHGFVSYTPFGESQFLVNWLDGRNTSGGHHDPNGGAMTLRAAIVNPNGSLEDEFLLDDRVCDCCQTSSALAAKGPVVVYRDRSEDEFRDVFIVRFEDGKWTTPVSVHQDNWQIHGCPVNGPRVAAQGETVAVAWFTAANEESKVNVVFSKNSGQKFEPPLRVDLKNPIGRVDVALIDHNSAVVCWMEDREGQTFIFFRKVVTDGTLGEVMTLTSTDASRSSGFPQMEVFDGNIYFAWTDIQNDKSQVQTKFIEINSLK